MVATSDDFMVLSGEIDLGKCLGDGGYFSIWEFQCLTEYFNKFTFYVNGEEEERDSSFVFDKNP